LLPGDADKAEGLRLYRAIPVLMHPRSRMPFAAQGGRVALSPGNGDRSHRDLGEIDCRVWLTFGVKPAVSVCCSRRSLTRGRAGRRQIRPPVPGGARPESPRLTATDHECGAIPPFRFTFVGKIDFSIGNHCRVLKDQRRIRIEAGCFPCRSSRSGPTLAESPPSVSSQSR